VWYAAFVDNVSFFEGNAMKNRSISGVLVVLMLFVYGCATPGSPGGMAPVGPNYRPVVDLRQGQTPEQFEAELQHCQRLAAQTPGAGQSAAEGAAVGALIFGALSALAGGRGNNNLAAAGVGALSAGTYAGAQGEAQQRAIVVRCLAGRGYSVLSY